MLSITLIHIFSFTAILNKWMVVILVHCLIFFNHDVRRHPVLLLSCLSKSVGIIRYAIRVPDMTLSWIYYIYVRAFEKYTPTQNGLSSHVHCMLATGRPRNTILPSTTVSHDHYSLSSADNAATACSAKMQITTLHAVV